MALVEDLGIYIPVEAEVRRVPLRSLPSSVLRKMNPSPEPAEPSDCVWICPVLFQRKGQKEKAQEDQAKARQHMLTVLGNSLGKHSGSTLGSTHWTMPVVTANLTAYKVLNETLPVGSHTLLFGTAKVPQGPLSNREQDAVIIYHGQIYLSVRRKKTELSKSQRPVPDQSSVHSQRAPFIQAQLKRKLNSPCDVTEMPQPKLSDCGSRGARHSLEASPEVSASQGANLVASHSQGSCQTACGTSSGASQASSQSHGDVPGSSLDATKKDQGHGAGVGAVLGASRDQRPQEEPREESPSQSPYTPQSIPLSFSPSWGDSEPPALPDWGPSEPSGQQQEFDFQELARKERIALIEAQLLKSGEAQNSL